MRTIRSRLDLLLAGSSATALAATILGLAVAVFWLAPLRSSLWLDETGTVWAVHGTLRDTWERAIHPGLPSVFFSILTWGATAIGGLNEITLRVPSLIASSIAAGGVYLLARRFCDAHQSLLACALFATYGTVEFAAADARPYALALMAVVWSVLMLIQWCETGKLSYGFACVWLVALSIYAHYLCATMLPLYAWYLIRQDPTSRPKWRHIGSLGVLLGALVLLLLPVAVQLWRLRVEHSFSGTPSFRRVIDALFYYRLGAGILAGLAVARWVWPDFSLRTQTWFTRSHLFLLAWYLSPILFLLAISLVSEAKLFVPRYYLWGIPGLAMLVASALSAIDPLPARRTAGLIILLAFCTRRIPTGPAAHGGQDWRGVLQAARVVVARSDDTLLLRSGFQERPLKGLGTKSSLESPLMAPLAMYPVPGRAEAVPYWLENADRRRWEAIVSGLVVRRAGFVFVSPKEGPPADAWLQGRISSENYRVSNLGNFAGITAIVFEPCAPGDHR
jgi:mannosyltransferase